MIIIKVKEGETIDRALRRYKKKFERTGILKEVRGRMFYKKPSEEAKEVEKKAKNRERHYARENY
ncbi:MAG: 30S ribosomal protein S21 [Bacteroidia bacterium]|nr:30S ribosomal protein S21 [Bacteroidia bacterium]